MSGGTAADKIGKGMKWLGAGGGAAVPAYAFWTHLAPPMFPEIGLILTALAGAAIALTAVYVPEGPNGAPGLPVLARTALKMIICSLMCLIGYGVFRPQWTVTNDRSDPVQYYQVGFGRTPWSLTTMGLKDKADRGLATKEQWVGAHGWDKTTPSIIWEEWTISVAGIILMVLFITGFLLWTTGFSLLAKITK